MLCEDQQHGVFLRKFLKKANPNYVDTLVKMCRNNALRKPAPTSLAAACIEYRRWADPA